MSGIVSPTSCRLSRYPLDSVRSAPVVIVLTAASSLAVRRTAQVVDEKRVEAIGSTLRQIA